METRELTKIQERRGTQGDGKCNRQNRPNDLLSY